MSSVRTGLDNCVVVLLVWDVDAIVGLVGSGGKDGIFPVVIGIAVSGGSRQPPVPGVIACQAWNRSRRSLASWVLKPRQRSTSGVGSPGWVVDEKARALSERSHDRSRSRCKDHGCGDKGRDLSQAARAPRPAG